MITTSKRTIQNNIESSGNRWSILNKLDTILIGDPYCGKSTYIKMLVANEKKYNLPILVSDDENEFEFWVGNKTKKAIFMVRDTANQERFRSLTQSYYRRAQCVLLVFNLYLEESFYNLNKWHNDVMSYCKNQDNYFSIVLVGLKNKPNGFSKSTSEVIKLELIEKFQQEKNHIIGYCEIDLSDEKNLKEPFEILLDHYSDKRLVSNNIDFNFKDSHGNNRKSYNNNIIYDKNYDEDDNNNEEILARNWISKNNSIISIDQLENTQLDIKLKSEKDDNKKNPCCNLL